MVGDGLVVEGGVVGDDDDAVGGREGLGRELAAGELEAVVTRGLTYSTPVGNTLIGAFYSDGGLRFDGLLDEIRISDIARSTEWIAASYNFQLPAGDFVTFGAQQIPEPATLTMLGLGALALHRRKRTKWAS